MFQRFRHVGMAAVRIRSVEETQALVVAIQKQIREPFNTQRCLVGMMPHSNRAGAHRQPAGLDSSLTQRHGVGRGEFLRQGRQGGHHLREPF
jgi:hypothetical protein